MTTRKVALAFVLLLISGKTFADCSDTASLPNNQWQQISLPCAAPAGASTVAAILGDDMGENAVYDDDWVLYAYNAASNSYSNVGLNGEMVPGFGYWIFNATGATRLVSMPLGSQPVTPTSSPECPSGTSGCTEAPLDYAAERVGVPQFNMIGVPSPDAFSWSNITVADTQSCSAGNGSGTGCSLAEAQANKVLESTAWQYTGTDYRLINNGSSVSTWSGMWVTILENAQPNSNLRLLLPADSAESVKYRITVGTSRSSEMDTSSETVVEQAHGTRIFCPVSHFSYDDPVVHPNQPAAAHLHMYWGNTEADAFSTAASLLSTGKATCEGGLNNKSAYWAPAVFNAQDEVVIPENIFVYYKSFSHTPGFDRQTIMPIPDGLEMLANRDVLKSGPSNFKVEPRQINGQQKLRLSVSFPMCLQVTANGSPVLSSVDNVSHLSYSVAARETSSDCPASLPYRIPQLSYLMSYDVPFNSQWYLSSDHNAQNKGASLHADYIAAWDQETMNRIVLCNRASKEFCQFISQENGQTLRRAQLPERFLSPQGVPLYSDSTTLLPGTDRTPFGTSLVKQ